MGHRVIQSLHKPCLASISVETVFKTPQHSIDYPVLVDLKKYKEGRKIYFPKPKKESKEEDAM